MELATQRMRRLRRTQQAKTVVEREMDAGAAGEAEVEVDRGAPLEPLPPLAESINDSGNRRRRRLHRDSSSRSNAGWPV